MSGSGFHVHGPHDHEVEHQAQHGDKLAQQVAIFSAVLATVGALVSLQSGTLQNEAMLKKNEAVLIQSKASDQWNFYQAKSNKGHLMELAQSLVPADRQDYYKKQIARYEVEKKEIKAKAEGLEEAAHKANEASEHLMHPHHRMAQALTLIQIAISLAAVTVLTKNRKLFAVSGLAGIAGLVTWGSSFFM